MEMDMDDSTVKMKAGDVLIQRGTNHAWANRSQARARLAFVLIDGDLSASDTPSPELRTPDSYERCLCANIRNLA